MRLLGLSLLALSALQASAAPATAGAPDVDFTVNWGASNAFHHVYNGKANQISVLAQNHGKEPVTLETIGGEFREVGGREKKLKVTAERKYALALPALAVTPSPIPYQFHSEQRTGEVIFSVYAVLADASGKKHRVVAWEGQVSIKEPQSNLTDVASTLFLYAILLLILGVVAYFAAGIFAPGLRDNLTGTSKQAKRQARKVQAAAKETAASAAEVASKAGVPNEFLPAHHAPRPAKGSKGPTSDVDSGVESSASTNSRRRSTRKTR